MIEKHHTQAHTQRSSEEICLEKKILREDSNNILIQLAKTDGMRGQRTPELKKR